MRPTKEDLDVNKLVVDAFLDGGPHELASPIITMRRPRCEVCGTRLITSIERTTTDYPYDDFHPGWYCTECVAYMAHETENILGWTIFAIMDGGGPGPMVTWTEPAASRGASAPANRRGFFFGFSQSKC
jgi:hypothetical protein